jgi:hypothetical protein
MQHKAGIRSRRDNVGEIERGGTLQGPPLVARVGEGFALDVLNRADLLRRLRVCDLGGEEAAPIAARSSPRRSNDSMFPICRTIVASFVRSTRLPI